MATTETAAPTVIKFEKTECSRCGGEGRYSYCQTMKGPFGPYTCFKCRGQGMVFTKRGDAANRLAIRAFSRRADELEAGDRVRTDGVWATVKEAIQETAEANTGWSESNGVRHYWFRLLTNRCNHGTTPDTLFRVAQSAERKEVALPLCVEYMELLTKAGKAPKAKAKAARVAEILEALGVPADWEPYPAKPDRTR